MIDLLWLLLPVAAGAGWFAGRRSGERKPEAYWDYATHFHRGLSDLFNDRDAIDEDVFETLGSQVQDGADVPTRQGRANKDAKTGLDTSADTVARDTADTHIALGKLFRRRGDVERAILIHEALIERPGLDESTRVDARYELARDYESAGLLDRSEAVFRELVDRGERVQDAYTSLLELMESQHDWARATELATEIAGSSVITADESLANSVRLRLAHYFCESSAEARSAGYADEADALLSKALEHYARSARANLMSGGRALDEGRAADALNHYDVVSEVRPDLMPEIIDAQFRALAALGDEQRTSAFIAGLTGQRNAYSVIRRTREEIASREGADVANRFFKDQIVKRPSLRALRDWAKDQLDSPRTRERDKVATVVAMLDRVIEDKPAYQCAHCGFRGNVLHWRCPSCGTWDSVSTIIGAEGE